MLELNRTQAARVYLALCEALGVPEHGPTDPHQRGLEHRAYLTAYEPEALPAAVAAAGRLADAITAAGGNPDKFIVDEVVAAKITGDWLNDAMALLGAEPLRAGVEGRIGNAGLAGKWVDLPA